jgi:D-proline reductase (dithiol) PrdB
MVGHVSPPPPKLFTDNVAWDKESTHKDDRASFLPIEAASELASEGLFRGLAARFHGVPTGYSQRKTLTEDAPEILSCVREDRADAAVLYPLCPTVSLVARHLENERHSYRNCRIGIGRSAGAVTINK